MDLSVSMTIPSPHIVIVVVVVEMRIIPIMPILVMPRSISIPILIAWLATSRTRAIVVVRIIPVFIHLRIVVRTVRVALVLLL